MAPALAVEIVDRAHIESGDVKVRDVDVVPGKEGSVEGWACAVYTSTPD